PERRPVRLAHRSPEMISWGAPHEDPGHRQCSRYAAPGDLRARETRIFAGPIPRAWLQSMVWPALSLRGPARLLRLIALRELLRRLRHRRRHGSGAAADWLSDGNGRRPHAGAEPATQLLLSGVRPGRVLADVQPGVAEHGPAGVRRAARSVEPGHRHDPR